MSRSPLAALAGAVMLAGGLALAPAAAQTSSPEPTPRTPMEEQLSEAEKQLELAARLMLQALRGIIASIPQYEMPEVLENGDIIIRRVRPDEPPEKEAPQNEDEGEGEGSVKL